MNHRTNHPAGSPRDILARMKRMERDVEQQRTDVQSVNDNNPNFADKPMDVGRYLVRLKAIRGVIAEVSKAVDSGASHLPKGILDPINKAW